MQSEGAGKAPWCPLQVDFNEIAWLLQGLSGSNAQAEVS